MAIHPDSSFPLLVRDQAEVIQIFIELMRESDRSCELPHHAIANKKPSEKTYESHRDFDD